jgi:phosphonoacetate hydrolase
MPVASAAAHPVDPRLMAGPVLPSGDAAPRSRRRVLLVVLDGLRADSIDPAAMPNVTALAARGVQFTHARTGFPSETMVGAGELFTGAWPERSGITSNWMPVPGGPINGVELKSLEGIDEMARGYGGRVLGATSLFQALARAGRTSAVIGKEGPAELAHRAGATWSVSSAGSYESRAGERARGRIGAPALDQVVRAGAGEAPPQGSFDDSARSSWFVRAAAAVDAALAPDLLAVWLTDPDRTQHSHGLQTPNQASAIRRADAAVGALLLDLERRGQLANTDVVLTSDHGFSHHDHSTPERDIEGTLRAAGLRPSHILGSGNNFQVRFATPPSRDDFERMRAAIAASPFADQVMTVIDNPRVVRGDTRRDERLTGRDLRQGSARAVDAYIVLRERDGSFVPARRSSLKAGHGSLGWSDLNNALVVAGPSFERARAGQAPLRSANAAGIVDVAPTILELLGAPRARTMQGRVLREAMAPGGDRHGTVDELPAVRTTASADVRLGERLVRTELVTERVDDTDYFVELRTHG